MSFRPSRGRAVASIVYWARLALRIGVRVIALVFVAVSPGMPPPPPPAPQEIVQVRQNAQKRWRRRRG